MSTPIDFFLPFFYQNNVIFTSCAIKNLIDLGNPYYSTQLVTQNMTMVDSRSEFLKYDKKINTKYDMKNQRN
jgi:hypothetical protein